MKRIVFILCSTLIVTESNSKQPEATQTTHNFEKDQTLIYVITINTPKPDSKQVEKLDQLTPVKKDEIKIVTSERFEISLIELVDGTGYRAQRNVTTITGMEYICDCCGAITLYKTTARFLNFMSSRGYQLTCQMEHIHGIDYVFNKK